MYKLFPIHLQGRGTVDIESLTSYIYRIAYAHQLYVGELLRYILKNSNVIFDDDVPQLPKYFDPSILIRPNKTTDMVVKMIEDMCYQELRSSTLLFLKDCLARPAKEFTSNLRWCPECFYESHQSGTESYFKLIWHFQNIEVCHIHRTPLISQCEHCGCRQTGYIRKNPIEYCQDCGLPLFKRKNPLNPRNYSPSWEHVGIDLIKFFDSVIQQPNIQFSKEKIIDSLESLYDYYWENEKEDYLYSIIPRDEWLSLIYKQKSITLLKLRRIAYKLDIPLFFLFNGYQNITSELINSEWSSKLPEEIKINHKSHQRDHNTILNKITEFLSNSDTPPSLKKVSIHVDVSTGYLNYRFPTLSHNIVMKHKQYSEDQQRKQKLQALAKSTEYFFNNKFSHLPKSRKKCYNYLRENTNIAKFVLKNAINEVYCHYENGKKL